MQTRGQTHSPYSGSTFLTTAPPGKSWESYSSLKCPSPVYPNHYLYSDSIFFNQNHPHKFSLLFTAESPVSSTVPDRKGKKIIGYLSNHLTNGWISEIYQVTWISHPTFRIFGILMHQIEFYATFLCNEGQLGQWADFRFHRLYMKSWKIVIWDHWKKGWELEKVHELLPIFPKLEKDDWWKIAFIQKPALISKIYWQLLGV